MRGTISTRRAHGGAEFHLAGHPPGPRDRRIRRSDWAACTPSKIHVASNVASNALLEMIIFEKT